LEKNKAHSIDIVIDKVKIGDDSRLFEAIESAIDYSKGLVLVIFGEDMSMAEKNQEMLLSSQWSCTNDNFAFPEIEPRLFSFNSPYGACPACHGLGKEGFFSENICPECEGKRLKPEALSVKIDGKNIYEVTQLSVDKAYSFFVNYDEKHSERERIIAENLLNAIEWRLRFLLDVGLDYLTLERESETLSAGEAQRIRLASQIGSQLSGTLYVLDEPTIGLHERDTEKLLNTLKALKARNNTVIVVEHDERTIFSSDYLVDLGPGAGKNGGKVMVSANTEEAITDNKKYNSLTLDYLRDKKMISLPLHRRTKSHEKLQIIGAKAHNLKKIKVDLPLRRLVCITGVSGSGKSSLMHDVLYKNLSKILNNSHEDLKDVTEILGAEHLDKVVLMDQAPIGRTPRSNPATYTGIFTPIRDFYASLEEARARGYTHSRFSFNVSGGRCEACEGSGYNLIEMHFLAPVLVECEVCRGKRFNRETLQVKYNGKNISDVLEMTVDEAEKFFDGIYTITDKLKVLQKVGLGYIELGQSATTLSGGEAQRIKLAKELTYHLGKRVLYLLDEPTVGLHYYDLEMLLLVLNKLVEQGNSVILIEHNMDIIKSSDYVIDLGPEGGDGGGRIVAKGTPEEIIESEGSHTGKYLKKNYRSLLVKP
jgi:excinuclease ABC subunit A